MKHRKRIIRFIKKLNKKIYCNWFIVILLFIAIIAIIVIKNRICLEGFEDEIPTVRRPFVNLYDDKGKKINVILLSHPFTRETGDNGSYEQYVKWKNKGLHFVGISSYSEFPGMVTNPHDSLSDKNMKAWTEHNYMEDCEAWLHCFRNPDKYITSNMPKALISESDFANERHKPAPNVSKKYDFIYICLKDNDKCEPGWQSHIRNWELAKKCLKIMCNKFRLKGLIVGRTNCELPQGCHTLMDVRDFMPYNKFIKCYQQCKFIFVPNSVDASPRTLSEALAYDLRCLVNYNILGGWKYVNNHTGEFFHNENDFEQALTKLLNNYDNYTPSKYYWNNYGTKHAGKRLRDFLCDNIPNLNFKKQDTKYIKIGT